MLETVNLPSDPLVVSIRWWAWVSRQWLTLGRLVILLVCSRWVLNLVLLPVVPVHKAKKQQESYIGNTIRCMALWTLLVAMTRPLLCRTGEDTRN